MAKQDLIDEAVELGVKLTGEETVAQLEEAIKAARAASGGTVQQTQPQGTANAAAKNAAPDFSWAVNVVKLNRAKAYVQQDPETSGLKGKALEEAVKERYVEIKGLLANDKPVRQGKGGRTVNTAADDGSND